MGIVVDGGMIESHVVPGRGISEVNPPPLPPTHKKGKGKKEEKKEYKFGENFE